MLGVNPAPELRGKFKELASKVQEKIEPQLELYETACLLSRGPDRKRAAHWTLKAELLERRLRDRMGLPQIGVGPIE